MLNTENIIAVRQHKKIYKMDETVVKVFDKDYSKADILNEALNQARVEETGLAVPSLLEVCKIDGKWAITSKYIPGKTLKQLMDENPEKIEFYLDLMVSVQLDILSRRAPLLQKIRDKITRKINLAELDATTKYDLHNQLESMGRTNKVCHGDFNPSNIIINSENKKPYIIDWSHATQGNAGADVAKTFLVFCYNGETDLGEKYLDKFCFVYKVPKEYIKKWVPIVAASLLEKANKEKKEFLMKWIS